MPNWTGGRLSVILRTIVQIFFIEVRLLILDTKDCQDLRLVDFIVLLTLARAMRRFSILAGVGDVFTFRVAFLLYTTDEVHAFIIKPDVITFFRARFPFRDSTIGYIGEDVSEMFDRIFQIIGIITSHI